MEENIRERIIEVLNEKGLNVNMISSSRTEQRRLNRQINEGVTITYETIMSIAGKIPNVSLEWLLTGEGSKITNNNKDGIPLYKTEAAAGFGSADFSINENDIEARYKIRELERSSFMLHVRGDSMTPTYNNGDVVAVQVVYDPRNIQWGKPHLISSRDYGLIIKRIYDNDGNVICISDNPNYKPMFIDKENITGIGFVLGFVRYEGI